MKKPNLIIGKKQIILASLTLMLGAAIYINYAVTGTGNELKATKAVDGTSISTDGTETVNAAGDDYFTKARLDKMTSRDEAIDTLTGIMNGGDSTEEEQAVATDKATALSKLMESETQIESLIKAAGFKDCVVYLDGKSANIVVKSGALDASQAAQIKDILLSEVDVDNENIRIFDVK
ncbi:MAG: SpoIIIAH-like family protein [Oscillospiraceae bacterium]